MAVTAQAGIFGFGPQGAKDQIATTFHRHKAINLDLGMMDDSRLGPMEIGSGPFPTFPYKAGYTVAGGAELLPRLANTFGWLLYAALGDVDSALVETGVYDHTFVPLDTDLSYVRWLTLKKYIPQKESDPDTDIGEIYENCKPVGLSFTLEADQPIRARLDFLGTKTTFVQDISGWVWSGTYENWHSVPVGCEVGGYIKFTGGGLTGEELSAQRATVNLVNTPLDIRQEKQYGSPELEDITIISRTLTFDVTIKWNNPELYLAIQTGAFDGTEWTSTPLTGELEVAAVATKVIGATEQKYSLVIKAPEIMWQLNGPPVLAGGQAVIMRFMGTCLETEAEDYTEFILRNAVSSYAWPAEVSP
jgi:hypothetical protein